MKKLVTHNANFHADDIFATATLDLVFKSDIEVIRSRDPNIIESGDIVYDVGQIYDPERNRFDHHQKSFNHHWYTEQNEENEKIY